jgi:isopentenyl diphosphate isomerase/L-lactate dehydrogenase-like FMN-dependent dehydrogenase
MFGDGIGSFRIAVKCFLCFLRSECIILDNIEGENATYRASQRCGSLFTLSSLSTTSLEEVATCGRDRRWFQLYIAKDRSFTQRLIKRVEQSGYTALVVTVDTPILGVRERDVRNAFQLPPPLKLANFDEFGDNASMPGGSRQSQEQMSGLQAFFYQNLDPSISWKDIEWIIKQTKLPVLLKGILSPEDAALAVRAGVAGIIVSNHGARQLDTVPATISVLPGVVAAVQGRVPIYLDGGIRRGTDVLKAIALGAKAVFIGRPILWGLAVNGEQGVVDVLQMLKTELEQAMTLAGVRNIEEIDKNILFTPPKI